MCVWITLVLLPLMDCNICVVMFLEDIEVVVSIYLIAFFIIKAAFDTLKIVYYTKQIFVITTASF